MLNKILKTAIDQRLMNQLKFGEKLIVSNALEIMRVPTGFIYIFIDYLPSENEWLITSTLFVPGGEI